ncbi:MFS general substrate transporter [Aspergillus affinis]|uniref:MFS general substrate transporter n=1 Tax=Aspergillus affinis TaxID=1070780 RepID=UPI0022FEB48E|nr:MFS general substrate transporter [Aspergillus affinis]KAI9040651.1 MFS general substrate transporter [Aspergillus affinis]
MTESHSSESDDISNVQEPTPSQPEFREGGYGWVCVACTFLINAHTWGINAAYGVFLSYYLSTDIFPGTTALEYAFVGGLSISCAMFIAPLATFLSQRISTRFVLNLGTILEAVSLITTSFVKTDWQLFLSQGICFGIGMGLCFCGSVGVASYWFRRKRSLVNGIASAGSGIGGLVYSLAVGKMIPQMGFPWAMRVLGILAFVVNVVCANLMRIPSTTPTSPPSTTTKEIREKEKEEKKARNLPHLPPFLLNIDYHLLLGWAFLSGLGYVTLLFSMSAYSVAIGLTHSQGSLASALLNLGQALGRPAVGLVSDKAGRMRTAFAAALLSGILPLVVWIFADGVGVTYFFAIAVGLFAGTFLAAAAPLVAEVVGIQQLGTALGLFWFVLGPPTAVAEAIAVQLRDEDGRSKPYLRVQLFVGSAAALFPTEDTPSTSKSPFSANMQRDRTTTVHHPELNV